MCVDKYDTVILVSVQQHREKKCVYRVVGGKINLNVPVITGRVLQKNRPT